MNYGGSWLDVNHIFECLQKQLMLFGIGHLYRQVNQLNCEIPCQVVGLLLTAFPARVSVSHFQGRF